VTARLRRTRRAIFLENAFANAKTADVASARFPFMKTLLTLTALACLSSLALADIQDPPMNDYGPTRKLGRGLANILFGAAEFPIALSEINDREGNAAAWTYGVVRGVGRVLYRFRKGVIEVATFPFPTYKGSYRPPYKMDPPWLHGGYEEFPPELGFESRYRYVRFHAGYQTP
jgi:putative exosortase-associated protein (TIGR04073 family)